MKQEVSQMDETKKL